MPVIGFLHAASPKVRAPMEGEVHMSMRHEALKSRLRWRRLALEATYGDLRSRGTIHNRPNLPPNQLRPAQDDSAGRIRRHPRKEDIPSGKFSGAGKSWTMSA
jgi:hypothetical protein